MNNLNKSLLTLGLLSLLSSAPSYADLPFSYGNATKNYVDNTSNSNGGNAISNPYYIGGTIGSSDASSYCDGETGCEDTDTAWKLFGGYQLTNMLSGEVGYVSLGDIHKNGENSDVSAFTANAVGSMQVTERFDVFAKVGAMRWNSDNTHEDKDGFGVTYGLGVKMRLSDTTKLRAVWQQYPGIETDNDDSDINMLSVGFELSTY